MRQVASSCGLADGWLVGGAVRDLLLERPVLTGTCSCRASPARRPAHTPPRGRRAVPAQRAPRRLAGGHGGARSNSPASPAPSSRTCAGATSRSTRWAARLGRRDPDPPAASPTSPRACCGRSRSTSSPTTRWAPARPAAHRRRARTENVWRRPRWATRRQSASRAAGERQLAELSRLLAVRENHQRPQAGRPPGGAAVGLPEVTRYEAIDQNLYHHLDVFDTRCTSSTHRRRRRPPRALLPGACGEAPDRRALAMPVDATSISAGRCAGPPCSTTPPSRRRAR